MNLGLLECGERVKPSYSGERAICPVCDGELVAHCGEIRVWHWQHLKEVDCDPWKEHETAWHREWKMQFPDEWQEVVLNRQGEKHIADVMVPGGLVIEFQNSSISTTTIKAREQFYGEMIWVVNAENFKDHFAFRSIVKANIASIGERVGVELAVFRRKSNDRIKEIESQRTKLKRVHDRRKIEIDEEILFLQKLQAASEEIDFFTCMVVEDWKATSCWYYEKRVRLMESSESNFKSMLQSNLAELDASKRSLQIMHQRIQFIQSLQTILVHGRSFKVVPDEALMDFDFRVLSMVAKESLGTLFVKITPIGSDVELQGRRSIKNQFVFLLNEAVCLQQLNAQVKEADEAVLRHEQGRDELIKGLKASLQMELAREIATFCAKVEELKTEQAEAWRESNELLEEGKLLIEKRDSDSVDYEAQVKKAAEKKKFKAMREGKGLYTFTWKHKRPTWEAAAKPIFFDFGEDYLWELLRDGVVKKVLRADFILNCRGW